MDALAEEVLALPELCVTDVTIGALMTNRQVKKVDGSGAINVKLFGYPAGGIKEVKP